VGVKFSEVSGLFYPDSKDEMESFFAECNKGPEIHQLFSNKSPRALIVPHAGYTYSGCTAYSAFQYWQGMHGNIRTVIVIGPAHRAAFEGIATISADVLQTPIRLTDIDTGSKNALLKAGLIAINDKVHVQEHSLEVQYPFIQSMLPEAKILPLLVGQTSAEQVGYIISEFWNTPGIYFVISSDLSHFNSYEVAQTIDVQTAGFINNGDWQKLTGKRACGYIGIQGMLKVKSERNLLIEQVGLCNSGDTLGVKRSVVGYGAWAIYE